MLECVLARVHYVDGEFLLFEALRESGTQSLVIFNYQYFGHAACTCCLSFEFSASSGAVFSLHVVVDHGNEILSQSRSR